MTTVATVPIWDQLNDPVSGKPVPNATITVQLNFNQATSASPVTNLSTRAIDVQTDGNGFWTLAVVPVNKINPSGVLYTVRTPYAIYDINPTDVAVPVGPPAGWQTSAILASPPSTLGVSGNQLPGGTNVNGLLTASSETIDPGPLIVKGAIVAESATFVPHGGPYGAFLPGAPNQSTPSGVVTGRLWAWGQGGVWNVMAAGAVGDGTAHLLSSYFGSLAAAQAVYPFVTALTQTIDWAAGQAANNAAQAAGGGRVYWPEGHYIATGTDMIRLRPFVTNYGDGYASFLDFTNNVFMTTGMHPSQYPSWTWRLANAVAAGASTVTLQTPAQASDFTVGGMAVLRAVQEDAAGFPAFIELVKVIAVNVGTGVLTLEEPIEDALADPEIGVTPYPDPIPEGANLHSLRLKARTVTQGGNDGQPDIIWGLYRSFHHHLWFEGKALWSGNGATKCSFEDIVSICHVRGAAIPTPLEIKSGCYRSTFKNLKLAVVNDDGTASVVSMINVGERTRDVTVENVDILAPAVNASLIASSSAVRGRYRHIKLSAQNVTQIVSFQGGGASHILTTQNVADDVRVRVSGVLAIGVSFGDSSTANGRQDKVSHVRVEGASGAFGGFNPASVLFGATSDCHVYDSVLPGPYSGSTGPSTNCHMWNCITDGPNDPATRIAVVEHGCLTTGTLGVPTPAQLFNSGVSSTAANNVVSTLTMPANYPWRVGDKIRFRITGIFTGANNTKNVGILDGAGNGYLLTVAAGVTSTFVIEGWIEVINATNPGNPISYRFTGISVAGATLAPVAGLGSGIASNVAMAWNVQAWVVNASDSVYIVAAEMQFSRVEDSLSAGATDSRT